MTEQQFNRIWLKPKQKAAEINAHSRALKGQQVREWAQEIFTSLQAQKELKARG